MCSVVMALTSALSGLSAFSQAESQRASQEAQAAQLEYQASVAEQNAQIKAAEAQNALALGEIEKHKVDQERSELNAQYQAQAGANRSLLAASGVEMNSGSAMDWLLGNANTFAVDMGTNKYNRALADWEAKSNYNLANYESQQYSDTASNAMAQASWLNETAGSFGNSLLMGALSGTAAGLTSYASSGGTFGLSNTSSTASSSGMFVEPNRFGF